MITKIPGPKAHHSIISDKCRKIHGDNGALLVAIEDMQRKYHDICENFGAESDVKIHVVMIVERS